MRWSKVLAVGLGCLEVLGQGLGRSKILGFSLTGTKVVGDMRLAVYGGLT